MINTHSPDEYSYENENTKLIMASILPKINLDPKDPITKNVAIFLYNQIKYRPTAAFNLGKFVYLPMYNLPMV